MIYAVWKTQDDQVGGFIMDEDNAFPVAWSDEATARRDLKNHCLYGYLTFIWIE